MVSKLALAKKGAGLVFSLLSIGRVLPRIGDMIAIPLFAWLAVYFWRLSEKRELTLEEKLLFAFAVGGFLADVVFVFLLP